MTAAWKALRPPRGPLRAGLLAGLGIAGCATVTVDEFETCSLDLRPPETDDTGPPPDLAGAAGDVIQLVGGPLTEIRDTRVEVGGIAAEVTEVSRSAECDECDECRDAAACAPCGLCSGLGLEPPVRVSCFGDPLAEPPVAGVCAGCSESMSFVVPALPAGWTAIYVVNRNGQSEAIPLLVLGPAGTGETGDTGATGTSDTGTSDTGTPGDTGATATSDTGTAPDTSTGAG